MYFLSHTPLLYVSNFKLSAQIVQPNHSRRTSRTPNFQTIIFSNSVSLAVSYSKKQTSTSFRCRFRAASSSFSCSVSFTADANTLSLSSASSRYLVYTGLKITLFTFTYILQTIMRGGGGGGGVHKKRKYGE